MPAHSECFPWPSHYGHYKFFEDRMDEHTRVSRFSIQDQIGVYEITLSAGKVLRVFICECYAFGVAEYEDTVSKIGHVDAIIVNSNWCSYSDDAKIHCRKKRVGLFNIKEFMAALNRVDFWNYLTVSEKDRFREKGWL